LEQVQLLGEVRTINKARVGWRLVALLSGTYWKAQCMFGLFVQMSRFGASGSKIRLFPTSLLATG
jgi:hypothetical protein